MEIWKTAKNHDNYEVSTYGRNPENKQTVNHKDGNKRNNHISNLELNTMSENITHAYRNGLKQRPDNAGSPNSKLSKN